MQLILINVYQLFIDKEIILGNCDEDTVMYYDEKFKLIKNDDDICLGASDDKNEDSNLTLNDCNRNNKIINMRNIKSNCKPTKKVTTTINPTPTFKSVWIYNESTDKCLYGLEYADEIPTYEKWDNSSNL